MPPLDTGDPDSTAPVGWLGPVLPGIMTPPLDTGDPDSTAVREATPPSEV